MIAESFRIIIRYIKGRRTRSFLTIIGIFIGIAAVVALISLGQGLQNAVNYQFSKIGSNRIIISPAGAIAGPTSSGLTTAKLYEKDVDTVKKVNGVEFATGIYSSIELVFFKNEKKYIPILGLDNDAETTKYVEKIGLYDIEKGRNPRPGEKYKAVLGNKVAEEAFDEKVNVGDSIKIGGIDFEVIGIQSLIGTGVQDRIIRIPKTALNEILSISEEVSSIVVTVKEDADTVEVADRIKEELRKAHHEKKGEEDFSVQTARNVIEALLSIIAVIQALLVGIAAISLLVGGIGIMNTMYTSVLERTRDIGIMKAIGAKNSDVLLIFILESGFFGLFGGAIGVLIGVTLSKLASLIAFQVLKVNILRIEITPLLIIGPLLFSFLIGVVSGVFPAMQASRLKPVDSLRYE